MTENDADSQLTVRASRELDAAPAEAWRSWTDPVILRRWWGPKGFTCPTAEMDVRVGGTSLVSMSAPELGFPEMFSTWEYSLVDRPHRLEFVFRFTDASGAPLDETGRPPGVPAEVAHTIIFEPLPGDRTRMSVREDGYTSPEPIEMSRQGLEQSLDKLTPLFTGGVAVV